MPSVTTLRPNSEYCEWSWLCAVDAKNEEAHQETHSTPSREGRRGQRGAQGKGRCRGATASRHGGHFGETRLRKDVLTFRDPKKSEAKQLEATNGIYKKHSETAGSSWIFGNNAKGKTCRHRQLQRPDKIKTKT